MNWHVLIKTHIEASAYFSANRAISYNIDIPNPTFAAYSAM